MRGRSFNQELKRVSSKKLSGYSGLKDKAEAMDGYSRLAGYAKASGTGPLSDPTAGVVMARSASDAALWVTTIDDAYRASCDDVRHMARELWLNPAIQQGTRDRYALIAVRLGITVNRLCDLRDIFLLEVGSRAFARGLIKYEGQ
ncbi:MAG: hypothetical protein WCY59_08760 [Anaerovoracaceae bacterium]|jgi:hypothetical protein